MRAIIPANHSDHQPGPVPAPAGGVCFHLRLPFGLLKKRYELRICTAKDIDSASPGAPSPAFKRVIRSLTTKAVIVTLLFIVLAETIFILYLVKCLFGIDFFPDFHLFS